MKYSNGTSGVVIILISVGLVLASVVNIMQDRKIADLSSRVEVLEMKK